MSIAEQRLRQAAIGRTDERPGILAHDRRSADLHVLAELQREEEAAICTAAKQHLIAMTKAVGRAVEHLNAFRKQDVHVVSQLADIHKARVSLPTKWPTHPDLSSDLPACPRRLHGFEPVQVLFQTRRLRAFFGDPPVHLVLASILHTIHVKITKRGRPQVLLMPFPSRRLEEARTNIDAALLCLGIQYTDVASEIAAPVHVNTALSRLLKDVAVRAYVPRPSTPTPSVSTVFAAMYAARWNGAELVWEPTSDSLSPPKATSKSSTGSQSTDTKSKTNDQETAPPTRQVPTDATPGPPPAGTPPQAAPRAAQNPRGRGNTTPAKKKQAARRLHEHTPGTQRHIVDTDVGAHLPATLKVAELTKAALACLPPTAGDRISDLESALVRCWLSETAAESAEYHSAPPSDPTTGCADTDSAARRSKAHHHSDASRLSHSQR